MSKIKVSHPWRALLELLTNQSIGNRSMAGNVNFCLPFFSPVKYSLLLKACT